MKPSRRAELLADSIPEEDISDRPETAPREDDTTDPPFSVPPFSAPPEEVTPPTPVGGGFSAPPTPLSPLETVRLVLDDMPVPDLKTIIEHCEGRIHDLQREEVEALEQQMRFLQDKLIALRGPVQSNGRNVKPLRNPANPNEVYTTGMTPAWVRELSAATGKPVWQLREESL